MSVAIGIAQPAPPSPPATIAAKISAGTAAPPNAASAGNDAARGSLSSPTASSRLISSPTTKKNSAISPSLTQWRKSSSIDAAPTPIRSSVSQSDS
jgi:hypothetical protein